MSRSAGGVALAVMGATLLAGCTSPAPRSLSAAQRSEFEQRFVAVCTAVRYPDRGDVEYALKASVADSECRGADLTTPESFEYFSAEQLVGIYDYFQSWLLPCLAAHGYSRPLAPKPGETDVDGPGFVRWSPYWSVAILTEAEREHLNDVCPPYPAWADP